MMKWIVLIFLCISLCACKGKSTPKKKDDEDVGGAASRAPVVNVVEISGWQQQDGKIVHFQTISHLTQ
ncbi:hypothetical protein ACFOEE_01510 [Pseudoalteromonas fenneropenaei]|uniref:Uncharacterized protein n=1 Tax=Pseudoalteromonas fenneropenaei TaxID=1737459 RepID=A0ABV7CF44_9GAMM